MPSGVSPGRIDRPNHARVTCFRKQGLVAAAIAVVSDVAVDNRQLCVHGSAKIAAFAERGKFYRQKLPLFDHKNILMRRFSRRNFLQFYQYFSGQNGIALFSAHSLNAGIVAYKSRV